MEGEADGRMMGGTGGSGCGHAKDAMCDEEEEECVMRRVAMYVMRRCHMCAATSYLLA